MATKQECPFYDQCGFVRWRRDKPFLEVVELPEDGDCGILFNSCMRVQKDNPIQVASYGPQTTPEFDVALPPLPNTNGRSPRRIYGGAHK